MYLHVNRMRQLLILLSAVTFSVGRTEYFMNRGCARLNLDAGTAMLLIFFVNGLETMA